MADKAKKTGAPLLKTVAGLWSKYSYIFVFIIILIVYAITINANGNRFNPDPRRPRRLLMHKREIMRLYGKVKQDGYSLIPLSVYFKGSRVKVSVGLCKGKKLYDKRQAAAERDAKRQIDRAMKERMR